MERTYKFCIPENTSFHFPQVLHEERKRQIEFKTTDIESQRCQIYKIDLPDRTSGSTTSNVNVKPKVFIIGFDESAPTKDKNWVAALGFYSQQLPDTGSGLEDRC